MLQLFKRLQFVKEEQCRLSDPANPHTLTYGDGGDPPSGCFTCGKQQQSLGYQTNGHYRCTTCNVGFHNLCYTCPRKIRHIYHSQHPLTRIEWHDDVTTETAISEHVKSESIFNKCSWCGGDVNKSFYLCLICGFCLDYDCARKSPPPTITYPKSHHHPLVFFPRPFLLPCDACGVVNISDPVYICFQCHYVVHLSCIDLPREIKIMLHPHRLSYTPYFQPEVSTCQICYEAVDIKYGQYACYHEGCSYVAHSKCATHKNVWDGNELEWEPEETIKIDIAPFEKVGVDLIKYFCHEHHLKLQRYNMVRDVDKQCEACIFPIDSRDFYACMQCDFYLHEVCASLPRKLEHASHHHPLFLEPSPAKINRYCSICGRGFCGFQYKCSKDDCQSTRRFKVDIRCILVPHVSTYKCHEHPLFIKVRSRYDTRLACNRCRDPQDRLNLQCNLCEFRLCYFCATIPDEMYYIYDEHPLSLCCGGKVDETYWCETCEEKIDPKEWFYTCTKCCIAIHIICILGRAESSIYMKHGYIKSIRSGENFEVVRNNSNTRPICCWCVKRCEDVILFKYQNMSFCSKWCALKYV